MSKQGLEGNRFPDGDKRTEESITERHSRRRNSIYKSRVPGQRVTYSGNQRWTFFFTAGENMRERWNMYFAKVIKYQGYFLRCSLNCLWKMKKVLVSLCRWGNLKALGSWVYAHPGLCWFPRSRAWGSMHRNSLKDKGSWFPQGHQWISD